MEKLLVIGVDRVVGANVALSLSGRLEVAGVSQRHRVTLEGCPSRHCDAADLPALHRMVLDHSPDWIVYCGSLADSSWGAADEGLAGEPQRAAVVAEAATRSGSRLTAVSTDAVFAGPRLFHAEDSPATAAGPLAEAARAVEQILLSAGALVVRTHAYGWGPAAQSCDFAEQLWRALEDGSVPATDAQPHASPILATDLALLLHRAYQRGLHGLCHMAGAERTNPQRFAAQLAAECELTLLPRGSAGQAAPLQRPVQETSLISRRAVEALETPVPMLREGLRRFVEQLRSGYRDRLQPQSPWALQASAA